jgi:hypothetical protein
VPPDATIVTRIATACGADQRELRETLQAWLVADGERRQTPPVAVPVGQGHRTGSGKPAHRSERLWCMGTNTVRRGLAVMAAVTTLGGTAACQDSGGKTGRSAAASPSATASARPADNGIAAKSESDIVKAAHDALTHARSVHVKGAFSDGGKRTAMDLRLGQNACEGSIKSPSNGTNARVFIRSVGGRTYMRSPEMIRALAGTAVARQVGDRWFYSSKSRSDPFKGMTRPADFAEVLTTDGPVSRGRTTNVDGVPALQLLDSGSTLYVATTGTPYPLRIEPDPPQRGERLDLTDYDAPLDVVAPPDAIDIDRRAG